LPPPASTPALPEKTIARKPGESTPAAEVDLPPAAEGQRTELAEGLAVCWQRGRPEISGWREKTPIWSEELAFPIADVVKGSTPNEVKVVSVDALTTLVVDVASGEVKGAPLAAPKEDADIAGLLAQVKALHTEGLDKMRAGDGKATLAICEKMGELAGKLADAKRPNEAFRIWAAAKKLRRSVAPEVIGKELPKEQQPGPEDLEF
jgi:hypothetical protein